MGKTPNCDPLTWTYEETVMIIGSCKVIMEPHVAYVRHLPWFTEMEANVNVWFWNRNGNR